VGEREDPLWGDPGVEVGRVCGRVCTVTVVNPWLASKERSCLSGTPGAG